MTTLQKSAWTNLVAIIVCVLISSLGFLTLTRTNAKGIELIVIGFVAACAGGLGTYLVSRKRGFDAHLDERERLIYRRSLQWSGLAVIGFLGCICIVPFFIVGGQGLLHAYYLPVIFLSTLFTAQFVHSAAILVQCAREADDGQ